MNTGQLERGSPVKQKRVTAWMPAQDVNNFLGKVKMRTGKDGSTWMREQIYKFLNDEL